MIWLFTDASPTGMGPWIGQEPTRDAARTTAFHTRKLTPSQNNYPTHQQETLAIVEAMEAFAPHLLHRQFTVVTDHDSLTKLMKQKNLAGRQQRWLMHISRFDFKIEYQPGAKNFVADHLSRIHEGTRGPLDISLKDPTIDYDSLELPDPTQSLKSIEAPLPLPILALNQTTPCTTHAKPKPLPLLPAVTLSVVAALNTLWTRLPAMQ